MRLLKIDMPPFARTVWASPEAKQIWEPKINVASRAYYKLELETVIRKTRDCTTRHINPDRMDSEIRELSQMGLVFLPMQKVGTYTGFAHRHPPVIKGKPWNWYGVVSHSPKYAEAFALATDRRNHGAIGDLLGYPQCCQSFFSEMWPNGFIDPIWQAAINTRGAVKSDYKIELPTECSPLWTGLRYIGVRLTPHLSCSFSCSPTAEIVNQWLEIGKDLEGIEDLQELLSLPCEWNCSKGIAIVTTPYFKISTNSNPCWPTHIVMKN